MSMFPPNPAFPIPTERRVNLMGSYLLEKLKRIGGRDPAGLAQPGIGRPQPIKRENELLF